jgi:hypothetical protein
MKTALLVSVLAIVGCDNQVPIGESSAALCPIGQACPCTCSLPHASTTCFDFDCEIRACSSGWGDCDGNLGNGCETSLATTSHCGSCGRVCTAGQSCVSGACVTVSCPTGQKLCGTTCIPSAGCCVTSDCVGATNSVALCYNNACWYQCGSGALVCQ